MSEDAPQGSGYDDTHRAFLQALLSRQTTSFEGAKPLLAAIQSAHSPNRPTEPEDITREEFDRYVHAVNDAVSPFDFEIRRTTHQTTRAEIYALVNTSSDAMTQMSTSHSADEIAFVKRVLDAMFETYNTPQAEVMAVTGMQALKLAKAPVDAARRESSSTQAQPGLTIGQAERVLKSMVQEGWFEVSGKGYYTLSPRALMELRGWLVDTYNEQMIDENDEDEEEEQPKIKMCHACRDIVTVGQRCPKRTCLGRMHDHCVGKMFRAQGNREICPDCKGAWVQPLPIGEGAARGARNSQVSGASSARRQSSNAVADDSDNSDDDSE